MTWTCFKIVLKSQYYRLSQSFVGQFIVQQDLFSETIWEASHCLCSGHFCSSLLNTHCIPMSVMIHTAEWGGGKVQLPGSLFDETVLLSVGSLGVLMTNTVRNLPESGFGSVLFFWHLNFLLFLLSVTLLETCSWNPWRSYSKCPPRPNLVLFARSLQEITHRLWEEKPSRFL